MVGLAGKRINRGRTLEQTRSKRRRRERRGHAWGKKTGSLQPEVRSSESKMCRRKEKQKTPEAKRR